MSRTSSSTSPPIPRVRVDVHSKFFAPFTRRAARAEAALRRRLPRRGREDVRRLAVRSQAVPSPLAARRRGRRHGPGAPTNVLSGQSRRTGSVPSQPSAAARHLVVEAPQHDRRPRTARACGRGSATASTKWNSTPPDRAGAHRDPYPGGDQVAHGRVQVVDEECQVMQAGLTRRVHVAHGARRRARGPRTSSSMIEPHWPYAEVWSKRTRLPAIHHVDSSMWLP